MLQSRVWGGIQHLGLFEDPAEPLLTAQMRANRVMAAAADLRPGQTVIETACGFGGTARYLAGEHGVRVHATNIAETQFVEARDLTQRAGLSHLVDYRYADYHDLPFADSSFDVWWCQEALLYSVQKRRVFEEAIRVLRPGGRLIMSDLLLDDSVAGAERESFTTTMKAPNMWSIGQWDALFAGLPVKILQRQDWRAQTVHTFRRVLDNLEQAQAELTARSEKRWWPAPSSASRFSMMPRRRESSAGASMPSSGETGGAQRTIAYVSSAGTKEIIALGIDLRAGRFDKAPSSRAADRTCRQFTPSR